MADSVIDGINKGGGGSVLSSNRTVSSLSTGLGLKFFDKKSMQVLNSFPKVSDNSSLMY
jgi:hypothetical protein